MEQANCDEFDHPASWVGRLRQGGQSALAEVFMGQRDRLLRMVRNRMDRRVARRVDPSDVLQETFVEASQRLEQFLADPPMPIADWLWLLAGQRLMGVHRQHLGTQKRDARQEAVFSRKTPSGANSRSLSGVLISSISSPSVAAAQRETECWLQDAVDHLDAADREILSLRHFEQLGNREAAAKLGITTAAASKRYVRALQRLREAVQSPLDRLSS